MHPVGLVHEPAFDDGAVGGTGSSVTVIGSGAGGAGICPAGVVADEDPGAAEANGTITPTATATTLKTTILPAPTRRTVGTVRVLPAYAPFLRIRRIRSVLRASAQGRYPAARTRFPS
jgi:hypothetical protein